MWGLAKKPHDLLYQGSSQEGTGLGKDSWNPGEGSPHPPGQGSHALGKGLRRGGCGPCLESMSPWEQAQEPGQLLARAPLTSCSSQSLPCLSRQPWAVRPAASGWWAAPWGQGAFAARYRGPVWVISTGPGQSGFLVRVGAERTGLGSGEGLPTSQSGASVCPHSLWREGK